MFANNGTRKKFYSWIVASVGTLAVGLAGTWVHYWGAPQKKDRCSTYRSDFERDKHIHNTFEKVIEDYQIEGKADLEKADLELVKNVESIVSSLSKQIDFSLWVLDCAKPQQWYTDKTRGNPPHKLKATVAYENESGLTCRTLYSRSMTDDGLVRSTFTSEWCRVKGEWAAVPNIDSVE